MGLLWLLSSQLLQQARSVTLARCCCRRPWPIQAKHAPPDRSMSCAAGRGWRHPAHQQACSRLWAQSGSGSLVGRRCAGCCYDGQAGGAAAAGGCTQPARAGGAPCTWCDCGPTRVLCIVWVNANALALQQVACSCLLGSWQIGHGAVWAACNMHEMGCRFLLHACSQA